MSERKYGAAYRVADATLGQLVEAARAGRRCPQNHKLPHMQAVPYLVATGDIRVEIYCQNYRVVEILTGPHAGARTAEAPVSTPPYKVLERGAGRPPAAASDAMVAPDRQDFV